MEREGKEILKGSVAMTQVSEVVIMFSLTPPPLTNQCCTLTAEAAPPCSTRKRSQPN